MNSDAASEQFPPSTADSVRRKTVEVAAEMMRGTGGTGRGGSEASSQSALTLYLALLTDRLPVYARIMGELGSRVGKASVEENLRSAGLATVQFYTEILAAQVSVFTNPDQLLQLRGLLTSRGMGPHAADSRLAAYLEGERELGRVAADVDCDAAAQLLIGACVNYAFTKMLLDEVAPRQCFVDRAIRGLRLGP
jgi:AefR-like transcriptional repressor, C-terminal domain